MAHQSVLCSPPPLPNTPSICCTIVWRHCSFAWKVALKTWGFVCKRRLNHSSEYINLTLVPRLTTSIFSTSKIPLKKQDTASQELDLLNHVIHKGEMLIYKIWQGSTFREKYYLPNLQNLSCIYPETNQNANAFIIKILAQNFPVGILKP